MESMCVFSLLDEWGCWSSTGQTMTGIVEAHHTTIEQIMGVRAMLFADIRWKQLMVISKRLLNGLIF
ncbi:hypothetical protein NV64_18760 [Erwinia sp. B116]|nr:hypothetical protein NV64_18760 [Erwinia sp. B116]